MTLNHKKFILALSFQVIIILILFILEPIIFTKETYVLLKIESINIKRSSYGDFLNISYEISFIPLYLFRHLSIKEGDVVYIPLKLDKYYWTAAGSITKTKPIYSRTIFIKGIVKEILYDKVNVIYGIENYCLQGMYIKNLPSKKENIIATVSINRHGKANLKQIYVNNEPWIKNFIKPIKCSGIY